MASEADAKKITDEIWKDINAQQKISTIKANTIYFTGPIMIHGLAM